MAIPDYARTNFDTLLRAAFDGNLAVMECRDAATREPRYVLCAVGRSDSDYLFTPFGHLDRLAGLCRNFGIEQTVVIAPEQAWAALIDGSSIIGLAGDMTLRRVRVMNDYRVELIGFTDGLRDWLRSVGLFFEMINWKLRFFVPVTDEGPSILSKQMQRHRPLDIARRS